MTMDLAREFERCKDWLAAALEYADDTHDIEDIWEGVQEGRYQFWPGKESAIITEFHVYPKKRSLHVFLAGGKLDELLDMWDSMEIYAKATGCASLSVSGRKGWMRALESRGAKYLCTTVVKEL